MKDVGVKKADEFHADSGAFQDRALVFAGTIRHSRGKVFDFWQQSYRVKKKKFSLIHKLTM